jgi:tripartite-type tricarboxylate transporter receptor subunit TctC
MRLLKYGLVLGVLLAGAMQEQAQADFYAGKRITMIIGFSAGGGVDIYGRLVARYLTRHIPGHPTVIPQNVPGAQGVQALRSLEANQPKDGTVITTFTPNLVVMAFTTPAQATVDFSSYQWIGSVGQDQRICYMWHQKGVKTWDDLVKRDEVIMGGTGSEWPQVVLQKLLGVKLKVVRGYPGSAEKRLAIQRGEVDGDCSGITGVPPDWIRDGKIDVLVRFGESAEGLPPGSVYAGDLLKKDPAKAPILAMLNAAGDIGRPFVVSKDVPAERVAILREAFAKTVADPEFKADIEKLGLDATPTPGEVLQARIEALYTTPPEVIAAARALMAE